MIVTFEWAKWSLKNYFNFLFSVNMIFNILKRPSPLDLTARGVGCDLIVITINSRSKSNFIHPNS